MRRGLRALARSAVPLAAALALLALGAALWLWNTEAGTRWMLARVPGLQVESLRGRITGGPFEAARVRWQRAGTRVEVERLAWRDLQLTAWPHGGTWLRVEWSEPEAQAVRVQRRPPPAGEAGTGAPRSLRWPVELVIDRLVVGTLAVDALPPLRALQADLHLGDERGATHRVERLSLQAGGVAWRGSGRVGADGDLALHARVQASADGALPWHFVAQLRGPLARPEVHAAFTAAQRASAQLRAVLQPFARWPLASLQAATQDLDLSVLAPALPSTRLGGRVLLEAPAADEPLTATVALVNAAPGAWDRGRLPLATLDARVQGRLDDRRVVELPSFAAGLDGGRIEGRGRWSADTLALDLVLHTLRPARLHTQAPPMALSGPLALQLRGLPSPDGAAAAGPPGGRLQARLDGRLDRARRPLRVVADAGFELPGAGAWRIDAPRVELSAGAARAEIAGRASGSAAGPWQLAANARWQRFDPRDWWPGLPRGEWRVDGTAEADLQGPLPLTTTTLRGHARLDLAPSRLAGLPVQGRVSAAAPAGVAAGGDLAADLLAAGNRVRVDLRATPRAVGRGRLQVDAPALAALAPLLPADTPLPVAGRLQAEADIEGPWATLRTEARVHGEQLRAPGWALDALDAKLDGSIARHRLQLRAATPLRPPDWVQARAGGTLLHVDADGAWAPAREGGGRWSVHLGDLRIGAREGGPAAWLSAPGLAAQVDVGADRTLRQARLAPGEAGVLGATLRWQQALWRPDGLALDARLEPMPVAPWLQRLAPDAGWSGDLQVAARAQVAAGAGVEADVVIERVGGDLALQRDGRPLALGLSSLRLALAAHGGTWQATQALTGAQVGVIAGSQTVRAAAAARWPGPEAPVEGAISLQTPDLDVWSPWLPAGWRVGGSLRAVALLAGRAGAPDWRGQVEGQGLALGNLFEGVDLADGVLRAAVDGDRLRIEQLRWRGGEGTLVASGEARWQPAPQARLELVATRLQALGRADRRIVASGRATAALDGGRLALDGRFTVDEGLIDVSQASAARLDDDVVVVNRPGAPAPGAVPAAAPRTPPALALALQVGLGESLVLQGRGLRTRLAGELSVSNPDGRLAVQGRVRTVGGTYAAYGQNLVIERGVIRFDGEPTTPELDILAVRPDIDQRVGVAIIGTAVNPRVRLYSEPEMSDLDKLSWLVLGRASGGLGTADTALLQRAALALLAGDRGGGPGVVQRLGLDELSVGQTGSGDTRDTVVTLGKQINRRLFVAYERGLNAAVGSWQLIYRIAQRFTLRASSGAESALDAIFTWRWE